MINRLIDMKIPVIEKEVKITSMNNGTFSVSDYANAFIQGMSEVQRNRFKKMLENGIQCGMSVAANYGIDYEDFITEVKKQMEV